MSLVSEAFAMGGPQGAAGPVTGTDMMLQFLPLILMFAIFYFLLIRPQQKRAKAHKAMLAALKKGDYVVSSGGLLGRILEIDEETILMECGEARLRISRGAIGTVVDKDGKAVEPAK